MMMGEVIKSEFGNFETMRDDETRELWPIAPGGAVSRLSWHVSQTEELVKLLAGQIGFRLVKIGQNTAAPATTNLDFWQAYHAMQKGEWVWNDVLFPIPKWGTRLEIQNGTIVIRVGEHFAELGIEKHHLDSTTWYILPKGPRYKVGDRFITGDATMEVVYIDKPTGEYVARLNEYGDVSLHTFAESHLNGFLKL